MHNTPRCLRVLPFGVLLLCAVLSGCVAVSNPVANGIPVRRLPPELLGESRASKETIPLSALRQDPPEVYRLAPGDVLGVWIEGVLGERNAIPPVHYPEAGNVAPALGIPLPVREDGTLPLPLIEPLSVQGMSIEEAQAAIRKAYTRDKVILQPGRDRIIVTLVRRRQYRVLVIRQEAGGGSTLPVASTGNRSVTFNFGGSPNYGSGGRSEGFAVDLPAYENDVLNALALTGGLPGFESLDEVLVERGSGRGEKDRARLLHALEASPIDCKPESAGQRGGQITRIPIRLLKDQPLPFTPEDIVLQTGDIVYVKAREADLYYTGGLLPPGEYPLPRDYDLDVLEAVSRIGGPLVSNLNANNINGAITGQGLGSPSPSLLTIIRRTPGCGQVAIRVDLNRACRDPRERINVQAGDVLILQETPSEAFTRYLTQRVFVFNLVSRFISGNKTNATVTVGAP